MIACCYESCGASICFTDELEARLRRTHEWWVCPFGHRQHFAKETPEEVRIRLAENTRDRWRQIAEDREEVFGTCPFGCGWRSRSGMDRRWLQMFKHFSDKHGNLLPRRMVFASRRENWPQNRRKGAA